MTGLGNVPLFSLETAAELGPEPVGGSSARSLHPGLVKLRGNFFALIFW